MMVAHGRRRGILCQPRVPVRGTSLACFCDFRARVNALAAAIALRVPRAVAHGFLRDGLFIALHILRRLTDVFPGSPIECIRRAISSPTDPLSALFSSSRGFFRATEVPMRTSACCSSSNFFEVVFRPISRRPIPRYRTLTPSLDTPANGWPIIGRTMIPNGQCK
jgi:hypothetical protein